MPNVEFHYVLLGALAIALVVAAITDIRRREIDNWLNAAIALAAPLYWWASGLSLWPDVAWQLGIAIITFAICAGLFAGHHDRAADPVHPAGAVCGDPWACRLFDLRCLFSQRNWQSARQLGLSLRLVD